jgi:hypothetical protein
LGRESGPPPAALAPPLRPLPGPCPNPLIPGSSPTTFTHLLVGEGRGLPSLASLPPNSPSRDGRPAGRPMAGERQDGGSRHADGIERGEAGDEAGGRDLATKAGAPDFFPPAPVSEGVAPRWSHFVLRLPAQATPVSPGWRDPRPVLPPQGTTSGKGRKSHPSDARGLAIFPFSPCGKMRRSSERCVGRRAHCGHLLWATAIEPSRRIPP